MDGPVDLDHPALTPFLDSYALTTLSFPIEAVLRLGEAHRELMQRLTQTVGSGLPSRIQSLDDTGLAVLGRGEVFQHYRTPKERMMFFLRQNIHRWRDDWSAGYRRHMLATSLYLHGTHVAGILLAGSKRPPIRLVPFPMLSAPLFEADAVTPESMDLKSARASVARNFAAVSEGLRAARIRVVSMSIGWSTGAFADRFRRRAWHPTQAERIDAYASGLARAWSEAMLELMEAHPDVLFVVSGGNAGTDVSDQGILNGSNLVAPNLVKVAASYYWGLPAAFNSESPGAIEIRAPGVGIVSARAGGDTVHLSGSSMAAPMVARRAVDILAQNPGFKPRQVIQALLRNHSVDLFGEGARAVRFLLPAPFAEFAPAVRRRALVGGSVRLDAEAYGDGVSCRRKLEEVEAKIPTRRRPHRSVSG